MMAGKLERAAVLLISATLIDFSICAEVSNIQDKTLESQVAANPNSSEDSDLADLNPDLLLNDDASERKADSIPNRGLRRLSLGDAIARLEKTGVEIKELESRLQDAEATYRRAKFEYWVPEINLSYNYGAETTLMRYKGTSPEIKDTRDRWLSPTSNTLNLNLFKYDLYSGGIPTLRLELASRDYQKNLADVKNAREQLTRDLVKKYFDAAIAKKIYLASLRSIELWRNIKKIYSVSQIKRNNNQRNDSDDSSVLEIEISDAEQKAQDFYTVYEDALTELNLTIGEPADQGYEFISELKYAELTLSLREVLEQIEKTSANSRDLQFQIDSQRISSQIRRLEQLAVGTVSFSGINVSYNFSKAPTNFIGQTKQVTAGDTGGSSNINVSLGLSFSMNILGPNGFMNSFQAEEEARQVKALENQARNQKRNWTKEAIGIYNKLRDNQKTLKRAEASIQMSISILDSILEKVSRGESISQSDLKEVVIGGTDRVVDELTARKSDLEGRIALDNLMGLDTMKLNRGP